MNIDSATVTKYLENARLFREAAQASRAAAEAYEISATLYENDALTAMWAGTGLAK